MRRRSPVLLLGLALGIALARPARADQVVLTNGQVVEGIVTVKGDTVEVRIDSGTIGFERREVKEIRRGASPLEELAKRKSQVARTDVAGLRSLAQWAESHGLTGEATTIWREVLDAAPDDVTARERLGYRTLDGKWVTEDEYMTAKGFVRYGAGWKTPGEVEVLEEEANARRERRAERERADLRARSEAPTAEQSEADQGNAADPGNAADQGNAPDPGNAEYWGVLATPVLPPKYPAYGPYYRTVLPYYLDPWSVVGGVTKPPVGGKPSARSPANLPPPGAQRPAQTPVKGPTMARPGRP